MNTRTVSPTKIRAAMTIGLSAFALFVFSHASYARASGMKVDTVTPQIYWSNWFFGSIGKAKLDGSSANPSWLTVSALGYPSASVWGVAVSSRYIYWSSVDTRWIYRTQRSGSHKTIRLVRSDFAPASIAVDGKYVYWTEDDPETGGGNSIGRAKLDGTGVDQAFIVPPSSEAFGSVTVNSKYIYWVDSLSGSVGRADINGSNVIWDLLAGTGIDSPTVVAADEAHLYVGDYSAGTNIARTDIDGSNPELSFIPLGGYIGFEGLAAGANSIAWSYQQPEGGSDYTDWVGRASADGSNVESHLISNPSVPRGVAIYEGFWEMPDLQLVGKVGTHSLRVGVKCARVTAERCLIRISGKAVGSKGALIPRSVVLQAGASSTLRIAYNRALTLKVDSGKITRIRVTASQVGQGARSIVSRVPIR